MWQALWEELEARRADLDAAVEEVARRIPAFAPILDSMTPELREQQRVHGIHMQRVALLEGGWDEYLADLRVQGRTYAQMGIPFADWYPLLGAFRSVLVTTVLGLPRERAQLVIEGMDRFLDLAMSAIGTAYVGMQMELAQRAQSRMQLYIDLFENAPMGMLHLGCTGRRADLQLELVAGNPAAFRLGGPALARSDDRRLDPEWAAAAGLTEHVGDVVATREPRRWKLDSTLPGTKRRTYEFHCFWLDDGHLGVVFEDVTTHEQLLRQVAAQLRELERSNRDLDEFAYVASHDLKAPLQDVRNLADWIVEDAGTALPERSLRHVGLLGDRVRRMERLLDDLLEYSRIGRKDGAHEQVSLRDVVGEVGGLLQPPADFTIEFRGDSPVLSTPRAPLEKVLRNLVGNAVKHHDRATGSIVVSAERAGDRVRIRVVDDGPGIPEEFHDRVFAMFQTLRSRDEVEGSGMGLTFVKKTVELYGGRVFIESTGRGAALVFDWPLAVTEPETGGGDDGTHSEHLVG